MSHSKRNTSLAFFTSYERQLLRGTWGSQSARLSSAAALPFGHCTLCLLPAVDPVACSGCADPSSDSIKTQEAGGKRKRDNLNKTHIFCRGCALENILAQKKEIKRMQKAREEEVVLQDQQDLAQEQQLFEKELKAFESAQSGLSGNGAVQVGDKGAKRKRLDNDERDSDERARSSFWLPSETPEAGKDLSSKRQKREKAIAPICPGSLADDMPHSFGLKSLTSVCFTEEDAPEKFGKLRVCPACSRPLLNSSKATLALPCGHVVCSSCTNKFVLANEEDAADVVVGKKACFVCGHEISLGGTSQKQSKKSTSVSGLLEISCEGTGFAGGGKSIVKRTGVAFQC